MNYLTKSIIFLSAVLIFSGLTGCSRQPKVPPVSLADSRLIIEMFKALEKNNVPLTLVKAEKIGLENNMFLSKLIETQNANLVLADAQKALNRNDLTGALKIVNAGLDRNPFSGQLAIAKNQLKELTAFENELNLLCKGEIVTLELSPELQKAIPETSKLKAELDKINLISKPSKPGEKK